MHVNYILDETLKQATITVRNDSPRLEQNWFLRLMSPITLSKSPDLSIATDSLSLMLIPYPEKMILKPGQEQTFHFSYREDIDSLDLVYADPTIKSYVMYDEDFTKHTNIKDVPFLHYFYNPKKVGRFIKNNHPNPDFIWLENGLNFDSDDIECYAHTYQGFFDTYNYILKFTVAHIDNFVLLMRLGEILLEREQNVYIFRYKKEIKCTFENTIDDVEIELHFRLAKDGEIKFIIQGREYKQYSIVADTSISEPIYLDFGAMDTWNAKSCFRRLSLEKKK